MNGHEVKFRSPVTKTKTPKIYIIRHAGKIVYVGYASQSIVARLQGGLRASGKGGYHGYGWKALDKVELCVFVFDTFIGSKEENKKYKLFVESIEAELVYLARKHTGSWPQYQREIHFSNERAEEVKRLVREIYGQL